MDPDRTHIATSTTARPPRPVATARFRPLAVAALVLLVPFAAVRSARSGSGPTQDRLSPPTQGVPDALEAGLRALREGRTPEAVTLLQTVTGADGTAASEAWLGLAVAWGRLERREAEVEAWMHARGLVTGPLADWVDLFLAEALDRSGQPARADSLRRSLQERLETGPVRQQVLQARLAGARARGDEETETDLLRILVEERAPGAAEHAYQLAERLVEKDPEAARRQLEAAFGLPGTDEARARAARRLQDDDPTDAALALRAGRIFHDISEWSEAEAALQVARGSDDPAMRAEAAYWLGMTRYRQRRWAEAADLLGEAAASPRWRTTAAYHQARAIASHRDRETGAAALVAFADTHPHSDWAPRALRQAADRLGGLDCTAARDVLVRLIREYPTFWQNAEAVFQLGNCARLAGDAAEARRWYVRLGSGVFHPYEKAQGWFWAARMASDEGDSTAARAYLERAAVGYPETWYGVQAARRLGQGTALRTPPPLEWVPAVGMTVPDWASEEAAAGIVLLRIGRSREGELQLEPAVRQGRLDRERLYALWERCVAGGAYDVAAWLGERLRDRFRWAADDRRRDLLEYPLYWLDRIVPEALRYDLDPLLVLALMKQESLYRSDARSFAGARGLMQLMPATAEEWTRRLRLPSVTPEDLYDPERNLQLGIPYLARLISQFDGSVEKALAAYNGGATNVRRWERGLPDPRPETFLEAIGYEETRTYVRTVLNHYQHYRYLWTEPAL